MEDVRLDQKELLNSVTLIKSERKYLTQCFRILENHPDEKLANSTEDLKYPIDKFLRSTLEYSPWSVFDSYNKAKKKANHDKVLGYFFFKNPSIAKAGAKDFYLQIFKNF